MNDESDINAPGQNSNTIRNDDLPYEHVIRRINDMFVNYSQNSTMLAMREALLKLANEGLLDE